jgi:hypothetical protein
MKESKDGKEKKSLEIKKKSSEIKLLIEKYQKTLTEIQDLCKHIPVLKQISENGVSAELRVVCENCEKVIGYPTKNDTEDFYKD